MLTDIKIVCIEKSVRAQFQIRKNTCDFFVILNSIPFSVDDRKNIGKYPKNPRKHQH